MAEPAWPHTLLLFASAFSVPLAIRGAKPTVLIVDDDLQMRNMFRTALRLAGFDAWVAVDGTSALWQLEQRILDVVVLDLDLPGMSSIAVHEELHANALTTSR